MMRNVTNSLGTYGYTYTVIPTALFFYIPILSVIFREKG